MLINADPRLCQPGAAPTSRVARDERFHRHRPRAAPTRFSPRAHGEDAVKMLQLRHFQVFAPRAWGGPPPHRGYYSRNRPAASRAWQFPACMAVPTARGIHGVSGHTWGIQPRPAVQTPENAPARAAYLEHTPVTRASQNAPPPTSRRTTTARRRTPLPTPEHVPSPGAIRPGDRYGSSLATAGPES